MTVLHEAFVRSWYVGLAVAPVLVLFALWSRRHAGPQLRHAVVVAVTLAMAVAALLPVVRDAGEWIARLRDHWRAAGLAPCLAAAVPPAAGEGCFTSRFACHGPAARRCSSSGWVSA